jgi:hypothetical protein
LKKAADSSRGLQLDECDEENQLVVLEDGEYLIQYFHQYQY